MAVFVFDTFTDTDGTELSAHTGETGATWTKHASQVPDNAVISDANRVRATGTAIGYYYASGNPATAEYDVEVDLYALTANGFSGIAGRIQTGSASAYLARYNSGTGAWDLYVQNGGSFTLLGSYSQALTPATAYAVKLEIRDAAKKVYIDGVERISSTDNTVTGAGKAGLWIAGESGTNSTALHMDNFTASDPGSGGGGSEIGSLLRGGLRAGLRSGM